MHRPALRAALVVSGLTLGCGAATAPASSTTTAETINQNTTETASASNPPCDGSLEVVSEQCCNETAGRSWSAADGRCYFTAVPGPFVPPSLAV